MQNNKGNTAQFPPCQYYLRFWLGICRTSLAVSALRIVRCCLKFHAAAAAGKGVQEK